ncbi:MAG: flagellar biosynthetic protein FliQ [Alphaproteobacteria bacterium]|jgi:flagellar biosynthetic protein FliQ|nr:flagellar biosynthetic protein FliQ [Alphaproteobacteria bacterium]MDP6874807.1 flagellar biosynthetic protein FliQ [Alphaproteobacteria bacterium]
MGVPEVLDIAQDAILTLLLIASPIMGVGLAVGLLIALVQALTSIQEMTLVFVPKIFAIFLALLVFMPFMIQNLTSLMDRIAQRIVGLS